MSDNPNQNSELKTHDNAAVRSAMAAVKIGLDPSAGPYPGERYIDERGEVQLFDPEMPEPYEDQLKAAAASAEAKGKAARAALIEERAKKVVDAAIAAKRAKAEEAGKEFKEPLGAEVAAMMAKEVIRQEDKSEKEAEKAKEKKEAVAKRADEALLAGRKANGQTWSQGLARIRRTGLVIKIGEAHKAQTVEDFNAEHADRVIYGTSKSPYKLVLEGNGFTMLDGISYAAGWPEVFEFKDKKYANLYRPDSVPVAATAYTRDGLRAIRRVLRHLRYLFKDRRSWQMVRTWIALNVRAPGKLIGVALLIKGVQGDGKTTILQKLMMRLMGQANVGEVSQQELKSNFNSWANEFALSVIEELKIVGNNRHEVMNQIKTLITNEFVRTIGKNANGLDTPNTTNRAGTTNFEDALPIDKDDRRWWILFTQFKSREDRARVYGDVTAYFEKLRAAIDNHGAELRKYFLECPMHPEVFHGMEAPPTAARSAMIAGEDESLGGKYLDSYLEEGAWGVCKYAIAGGALSAHLGRDMRNDAPRTKQLARLIESRGFVKYPKVVKWQGKTYQMYVDPKFGADSSENNVTIRDYLDQTTVTVTTDGKKVSVPDPFDDGF